MNITNHVFVALCDVSLASIIGWSEITASDADFSGGIRTDVARRMFVSKHPVSRRLLIVRGNEFEEWSCRGVRFDPETRENVVEELELEAAGVWANDRYRII